MQSIWQLGNGQGTYYVDLASTDYYVSGGEPLGYWMGEGAARLGLAGTVEREPFLRLFLGHDPRTNQPLVQNAGDARRQPGWDLTFSAPKSVSVAWAIAPRYLQRAIQHAHDEAVKETMALVEADAAWTRRGHDGQTKERAKLVVAAFRHGTSRAQDPQVHTHCIVLNVAVRTTDATTGTVESKPLYRYKMASGALYRTALGRNLERIGFELERTGSTFEISGVPKPVVTEFSKRRQEIEAELQRRGLSGAKASAAATLVTRGVKEHVAREGLLRQWKEAAALYGFTPESVTGLQSAPVERDLRSEMVGAVHRAKERLAGERSHFAERDLLRYTAEEAQGRGIGATQAWVATRHEIQTGSLVFLGLHIGERHYTTPELLELEKQLLADVDRMRATPSRAVSDAALEASFQRTEEAVTAAIRAGNPDAAPCLLSDEQRRALRHLAQGAGSVSVLSGLAGTGKTLTLQAAREAWEAQGSRVIGAALSGKAASGLQAGTGIPSSTLAKLFQDLKRGSVRTSRHLSPALLGMHAGQAHPARLDAQTILVLDEAGMVGTRQMAAVVAACQQSGAKLVLVGDAAQLQPIEVGGPFHHIEQRLGRAQLRQIQRQELDRTDANPSWRREAVLALSEGRADEALAAYTQRGFLHVAETRGDAKAALIAAWEPGGTRRAADHLILASTRQETQDLNRMAQAARRRSGKLGMRSVRLGTELLFEHDRLLVTRNDYHLGVRNGDLGSLEQMDLKARRLLFRLDRGGEVWISYERFQHITLGYAITTHKGQGATVQHAYILCGGCMADREMAYTQASRARRDTHFFTECLTVWDAEAGRPADRTLQELARAMGHSRQKDLAHTVLAGSTANDFSPEHVPTL